MTLRKTPRFASWLQTKTLDLHSFQQNGWKLNEIVKHLNDTKSYSKVTTEDLNFELELYFYLNTVNLSDKIIIKIITIYFNLYKHDLKI